MTEITLVAFDLDGTLLDSKKRIPPDAREAVSRMQESSIFVTLVTGRSFSGTAPYARELEILTPMGLVHGALVRDMLGLEIGKRAIPAVGVAEAVELAKATGCVPMVIGIKGDGNLTLCEEDRNHPAVLYVLNAEAEDNQIAPTETVFLPRAEIRIEAYAIFAMGLKAQVNAFLASAAAQRVKLYNAELYPVHAKGPDSALVDLYTVAMLTPIGAGKRYAIEVIADSLGVAMENVLAFGDWHNDIGMLEAAGTSVLMGNAPPGLADKIRHPNLYRTGHNDEGGIVDALRRFGLI
jgi:hypothetical protein